MKTSKTPFSDSNPAIAQKNRALLAIKTIATVSLSALALHSAQAQTLSTVTVTADSEPETATGPVTGYRAKNAATATKTDTPLAETPQSVTVVTRDQMLDQGASGVQDALGYAAGVRSNPYGVDSRGDWMRVRGSAPDVYLDGLRQAYGYYTSTTRTEPHTLERLEVLRGPSGMLFGAGTAAGVVNMVSKRPQKESAREIGVQYGSFGRKQLEADLTGALTPEGDWSYRLIALSRKSGTQVDFVADDRSLLAPSLTWQPSAATTLTLQALWQKDHSGSTSQFFPWSGTLLPNPNGQLPTRRFIGEPDDYYDSHRQTFGWLLEHQLNDSWSVRQNFRVAHNRNDNRYHYGDFFSLPGGWGADPLNQRLLGRINDSSLTQTRHMAMDTHVQGRFATAGIQHTLLAGLDLSRQRQSSASGNAFNLVDAYSPVYGDLQIALRTPAPDTTQRQTGLYLQDQMKLGRWVLLAGLRHDRAVAGAQGSPDEDTGATTKRLGLLYASPAGVSPYVSYSESFTPQAARNGQNFKPLRGEQWEVGVKYEPKGRALALSAAVYDLREKNQIASPLPNVFTQLGLTRVKGVELEAKGAIGPRLELVAHYNYTQLDEQLEGLPRHQASAWAKYRFALGGAQGFSAGLGLRWMGSFRDLQEGVGPRVPAVLLADAVLAYETDKWRYALNLNNLGDKAYTSTCLSRGDCWYGARRNVMASATYRF